MAVRLPDSSPQLLAPNGIACSQAAITVKRRATVTPRCLLNFTAAKRSSAIDGPGDSDHATWRGSIKAGHKSQQNFKFKISDGIPHFPKKTSHIVSHKNTFLFSPSLVDFVLCLQLKMRVVNHPKMMPTVRHRSRVTRKRPSVCLQDNTSQAELMEALVLLRDQIPSVPTERGEENGEVEDVIWAAVRHIRSLQKALVRRRLERLQRAARAAAPRPNINVTSSQDETA